MEARLNVSRQCQLT